MSYNESLKSNSNYPPMSQSEWDNAPWNQVDPPEMDFDVNCSFTVDKVVTITTDNYIPDGDGYEIDPDTSELDWADEYADNGYLTIPELLAELKKYVEKDMGRIKDKNSHKYRRLKMLSEECDGWQITNSEFEEQ